MWRIWRSITSRSRVVSAAPRTFIRCTAVSAGASGFRSSWPSIARNSSLARSAASASARAALARVICSSRSCWRSSRSAADRSSASSRRWSSVTRELARDGRSPLAIASDSSRRRGELARHPSRDEIGAAATHDEQQRRDGGQRRHRLPEPRIDARRRHAHAGNPLRDRCPAERAVDCRAVERDVAEHCLAAFIMPPLRGRCALLSDEALGIA